MFSRHPFLKEGHEVKVFERSDKTLVGRGGGIGTTPSLMEQIRNDGLINGHFAHFQINRMPFVGKSISSEPFGKTAWAMPVNFQVFQWKELWENLRNNVHDENYRVGMKVVSARLLDNGEVELSINTDLKEQFDLVIFADGYNSLGRSILFPEIELQYRGYVLWRGLLPESELQGESPLKEEILRLSYDGEPGHNVVYFIPDQNGSVREGERVYNWAAYIAIPETELDEVMTDNKGKIRVGTLPPGSKSEHIKTRLKSFLTKQIPASMLIWSNKPGTAISRSFTHWISTATTKIECV